MNYKKQLLFLSLFVIVFPLVSGCLAEKETERPNVVWITSEDNSKHYLKMFDDNGVATPNIESLAEHGLIYTRAFSNSPVCSAARSTIISGCYGPRTGSHYHRKMQPIAMPAGLKMFPAYLRAAGYYTANNSKEDYNFIKSDDVWDESSGKASWKNRGEGQPFFYVFNVGISHEARAHFTKEQMENYTPETSLDAFEVQPNHPNTPLFNYTNALYRDKIKEMDRQVGEVMKELREAGLFENSFIFYFGDHGGILPGSKGYIYEAGLHVPMVVHVPEKYKHLVNNPVGSKVNDFVSFVDLAPTVLSLAGVDIPEQMDGKPFMGEKATKKDMADSDVTYGYADRLDHKYDMVRSVRKGKFKYIRSYTPFNYDGLMTDYRYKQMAYQEWLALYTKGELNEIQSAFFETRSPELLFDIDNDPFETNNLANNPEYQGKLLELRQMLINWQKELPDLSFYPEHYLVDNAFEDPIKFGQEHKADIQKYLDIANLHLEKFDKVREQIKASLESADTWERYWGLITCSSFGDKAKEFIPLAKQMAQTDPELINKVRAAEFLGIVKAESPANVMTRALYATESQAEALLILNSIVLMRDIHYNYTFDLDAENINKDLLAQKQVEIRLGYLGAIK